MKTIYDKALSLLQNTIEWSNGLDLDEIRTFLTEDDGLPRIFLGSGGSLSAAHLAAQLSVESGMVAVGMSPYQYIFSAWSRLPAKVVILSAGGRNVDAINAYRSAKSNELQQASALIFTPSSKLKKCMKDDNEKNAFVFNLLNSDGFLATNSLLAFYLILIRIYRKEKVDIDNWDFKDSINNDLQDFLFNTYNINTDTWDSHNAALYHARETDRFYVLYSPDNLPIAYDLESRFSEGSIGCLQISDYRNFAHGRFNWFHQRKGQTGIIALISPEGKEVAENILSEIPPEIPIMRLRTDHTGSKGIVELLLEGMYLAHYMGMRWGMDIGAPQVAKFGKIIHSKDFMEQPAPKEEEPHKVVELPSTIAEEILSLPIPNICRVNRNIIRGESLWLSRNRKFLREIKDLGIEYVIDFRPVENTDVFSALCGQADLKYYHFPIEKSGKNDIETWNSLPQLFRLLDSYNCYISCENGLHLTDIALSIYYMFHNPHEIPVLIGHERKGQLECADIMQRINSLYKALDPKLAETLDVTLISEGEFRHRRKLLLNTNRRIIEER